MQTSKTSSSHNHNRISLTERIKLEWSTWASLAFVAALMEGSVVGIIIKNGFDNHVNDWLLNLSVAVATGAPYFSNLTSFFWVKVSRGKSKATLVSNLAILFCVCCFLISVVSFNSFGLMFLIVLLVIARSIWSGILTIRSNIWRVNYPRSIRAKVTAKLATLAALLMSFSSLAVGYILDWDFDYFRLVFIGFSCLSVVGAYRYRRLAVRNQHKEILREKAKDNQRNLASTFSLLLENRWFGKYMLAMFLLGSGNLMFMAPLIVFLNEHTSLTQLDQILITTAIPLALIPFVVGLWAKLLDGHHIFYFRALHSWGFVLAILIFFVAQMEKSTSIFYLGSFIYGIAISGGVIGWNLGHNDFVKKEEKNQRKENPMDYMAVHVTLTGVRGLIMPLLGIGLYQWLELQAEELGRFALLLPFSFTTSGAILFVIFSHQYQSKAD